MSLADKLFMKALPLILLCASAYAYAVPLPPTLPPAPLPVKRTAPLLSPKAASAPKSTPMFVPASVPSGTPAIRLLLTNDVTIINPAGEPESVDWHQVEVVQPAGFGVRIYQGGDITAPLSAWNVVADWGPYVEEQLVGWVWFRQTWTRTPTLFYRRELYSAHLPMLSEKSMPLLGGVMVNKSVAGTVRTYTRPIKKGLLR